MRSTMHIVSDAKKQWNLLAKGDTVEWCDHKDVKHIGVIFNKIEYGFLGYYLIEEHIIVDHKLTMLDGYTNLSRLDK